MKKLGFIKTTSCALALSFAAVTASHAGLIGSTVEGTLAFNYPTPVGQYWTAPTQVVGAGTEYSYYDGANHDFADFGDLSLTLTDDVLSNANGWLMTFQSDAFLNYTVTETSDSFDNGGVGFTQVGDLLSFFWVGTSTVGTRVAQYSFEAVATPEPAMAVLLASGLIGFGLVRRKNKA